MIVEADAAVTVRRIGRPSAAPDANPLLPLGFGQCADGTDDADGRIPTSWGRRRKKVLCDGRRLEPCRNRSPVIPFSRSGPDQRFLLQERAEPPTPCSADLEIPVEGVSSDSAARRAEALAADLEQAGAQLVIYRGELSGSSR